MNVKLCHDTVHGHLLLNSSLYYLQQYRSTNHCLRMNGNSFKANSMSETQKYPYIHTSIVWIPYMSIYIFISVVEYNKRDGTFRNTTLIINSSLFFSTIISKSIHLDVYQWHNSSFCNYFNTILV